jgi:hypothetical protein
MGEEMKKEKRQLRDQADGGAKDGEDRDGGWDRLLNRLAFGCMEVVG